MGEYSFDVGSGQKEYSRRSIWGISMTRGTRSISPCLSRSILFSYMVIYNKEKPFVLSENNTKMD